MSGEQPNIERIVREVLRRLAESGDLPSDKPRDEPRPARTTPVRTEPSRAKPAPTRSVANSASSNGQLTLNARVITTALLASRIDGIKRIVVPPRAVITPAVRDILRKKQITLVAATESAPNTQAGAELLVAVVDPAGQFGHALSAIGSEWNGAQRWDGDCVIRAVREVTRAVVQRDAAGIILTRQPSLALCQSNRRASVRAAWGTSVAAVKEALQSIGANVLVVDPTLHGVPELRGILREFVDGSHSCPKAYRTALEA